MFIIKAAVILASVLSATANVPMGNLRGLQSTPSTSRDDNEVAPSFRRSVAEVEQKAVPQSTVLSDQEKDMLWIDIIESRLKTTTNEAQKSELMNALLIRYRDLETKLKQASATPYASSKATAPATSTTAVTGIVKDNTFVVPTAATTVTTAVSEPAAVSAEVKDNTFVVPTAATTVTTAVSEPAAVSAEAKDNTFVVPTAATTVKTAVSEPAAVSAEAKDISFIPA